MISVIVPVYNAEEYISEAIESILHQTFKDLEIILIDDGSLDKSGEICDRYAAEFESVVCYHYKNGGLPEARNRGLKKAKGEYIYFMDSDDLLHPLALECLYRALEECDADISLCGYIRSSARKFDDVVSSKPFVVEKREMLAGLFTHSGDEMFFVSVWNKLYKKSLLKELFFNKIIGAEDVDFNARVFLRANRFAKIDMNLYLYYINPSSLTQSSIKDSALTNTDYIHTLESYYNASCYLKDDDELQALALLKLYYRMFSIRYMAAHTEYRKFAEEQIQKYIRLSHNSFRSNTKIGYKKYFFYLLLRSPQLYGVLLKLRTIFLKLTSIIK